MEKPYVTPYAEFIRITGDSLTNSNPRNAENGATDIKDMKDFNSEYNDWDWLI